MIIVNDLCVFHDLYTSLSVTFVMYFNGHIKTFLKISIIIIITYVNKDLISHFQGHIQD